MANPNAYPSTDPQLEAMLDALRPTPERDPQVVAANRAKFENELNVYLESASITQRPVNDVPGNPFQRIKEYYQMYKNKYRIAFMFTAVLVFLTVFLFGGASMTVSAAQAALPGDALYPVKTGLEQTQARLVFDAYDQAQLYMKFAELRLNELAALIDEGRYDDISMAVTEFEAYIQQSSASLEALSSQDPEKAAELTRQISDTLSRFAQVLTGMLAKVPAPVVTEMERAIRASGGTTSESGEDETEIIGVIEAIMEGAWVIDGQTILISDMTEIKGNPVVGDLVKVHVSVADDGSLTAREVELASGAGDGDLDDNDNGNVNDNDNTNDNDDDRNDNDDDVNDNDDDDVNDNDDSNDNYDDSNDNDGDDSNDNDDDSNDNDDDDSNDNDDDDSNDNDDDDSNDNDDDDSNDNDNDTNDNDDDDDDRDSNDNDD